MLATLEDTDQLTQFRALSSAGNIDFESGVIKGASILTIGPALGHNGEVDETGLEQALRACLNAGPDGVNLIIKHDGEFEDIVGGITNFRRAGLQLLGDIQLDETHPARNRILENARKRPTKFGLSIESFPPPSKWEKSGDRRLYRCTEMSAVALVPTPAANPRGLFSRGKDAHDVDTSKDSTANTINMTPDELKAALADAIKPVTEQLTELQSKFSADGEVTKLSTKLDEQKSKLDKIDSLPTEDKIGEIVDKKLKEGSEKTAADAVTKFAATIGVKKAPDSKTGDDNEGVEKTSFTAKIKKHREAGAKDDATALVRAANDDPKGYDEWCKAGRPRE